MTDIAALDALIEAVEAGDESWVHMPRIHDLHTDLVWKSWSGSLDAAKALHDALLPGWVWQWCNGIMTVFMPFPSSRCADGTSPYPARAWLIAILKAYRANHTQPT